VTKYLGVFAIMEKTEGLENPAFEVLLFYNKKIENEHHFYNYWEMSVYFL
jgi:hypothetical protein